MKRIANSAMSPVVTNVGEAVRGRLLGRVIGCEGFFIDRHLRACEHFLHASYTSSSFMMCNALATQLIALTVSVTVALYVILDSSTNKDVAGIALTYAFLLPYFLSLASDMFMNCFSLLPALERIFEYLPSGNLTEEAPRVLPTDVAAVTSGWPQAGDIVFDKVDMRYRHGQPRALKEMSVEIKSGEKCGIVGRTGAGKSSLLSALFRLVEPSGGAIRIDGVDVSQLGLKLLRESLAMIPQEAVLIEGTVRENLDPFSAFSTRQLELVLGKVGLAASMLSQQVGTGGDNLSVGERQLLAIARVLLKRGCKIYVMDEPTAHIDPATDAQLQKIIRRDFRDATLLTIAHRLHTVADFDKILVMDAGHLVEVGRPIDLLNSATGPFRKMVDALGPEAAAAIQEKAAAALKDSQNYDEIQLVADR